MLTAGRLHRPRPRFLTVGLHRNLSLLAVAFLTLHVGTTVLDSYTSIPLSAAFIPFVAVTSGPGSAWARSRWTCSPL